MHKIPLGVLLLFRVTIQTESPLALGQKHRLVRTVRPVTAFASHGRHPGVRILQATDGCLDRLMTGKAQLFGVGLDQMLIIRSVRLVAAGTLPLLECLMDALILHPLGQIPVTGQTEFLGILSQQGSLGGVMGLMAGQALPSGSRRVPRCR